MTTKKKLAALVPAHNEEGVIAETLKSLLEVFAADDVYVVSDGSTDKTETIAANFTQHVLPLHPNRGKAKAMNAAIEQFKLTERYEYLLPMDADTKITKDFVNNLMAIFEKDTNKKVACAVGKVIGKSHSWVTTFRLWEYEIAQTIHKAAQSVENAIIVCPGCATIYRSEIFKTLPIPTGTLTEDMDMTFQIHRKCLGRIVFTGKATVVTQDPKTLKDFCKQIDRWYTGFWQCIIKNNVPWGGQALDAEVAMLALEGLYNGVLMLAFLLVIPFAMDKHPYLLIIPAAIDLFLFLLPTMALTAWRHRTGKIFLYIPLFYVARFLACLIFLKSFFKIVFSIDYKTGWNKATRYTPN
ncbi:glycosyltransferase family 2 protein [Patescibacteria group bacterium]|nr:glycosyltransferase family 2 protein [Patescibacteria group bacterium]